MKPYKVPLQQAQAEYVEKKSRFIGQIFQVTDAEQAQEALGRVRKQYWDASHHVYAYLLRDGAMRFSDDGEPQGTSGMPTLEVLRKEEVFDVLCVTTRYFGGTLLGAGGLVRAYSHTCKLALDAAGLAVMQPFAQVGLCCPYAMLEPVRRLFQQLDGVEKQAEYAENVCLTVLLPEERFSALEASVIDLTRGQITSQLLGTALFPQPLSD